MTSELKYKIGDKILIEAKIVDKSSHLFPNCLKIWDSDTFWVSDDELDSVSVQLPPKPKVPQFVIDYWLSNKDKYKKDYVSWFLESRIHKKINKWIYNDDKSEENSYAFATLISRGVEYVEVEKTKYKVTFIPSCDVLSKNSYGELSFDGDDNFNLFTKEELIKYGLETVFDNELFEVEEVY